MNPYNFVPVDWNTKPLRRASHPHHKFGGIAGQIQGTIKAETPLFIRNAKQDREPLSFMRNRAGNHIIPNTSLKGLLRSLVETVGNGCFSLFDGEYQEKSWPNSVNYQRQLPNAFKLCNHPEKLCVACRLFGTLVDNNRSETGDAFQYKGNVSLNDAVATQVEKHEVVYLPPLFKPRSYHAVWYLDGGQIAGRKFYYHQRLPYYLKTKPDAYRQQVQPLGPGSTFPFNLSFQNLNEQDEWPLLLYALTLEENMRHKIGYGKPAGLGSIKIDLTEIKLIDYKTRYTKSDQPVQCYQNEALEDYLATQTKFFREYHNPTLDKLREIWRWPALKPPTGFGYPTRKWFKQHPKASIEDSWNAPRQ